MVDQSAAGNARKIKSRRTPQPARYPPTGVWPAQMRADMVAAYMDFRDTSELKRAICRGHAPPPSALRGAGRNKEPVWDRQCLDRYLAPRNQLREDELSRTNLAALV